MQYWRGKMIKRLSKKKVLIIVLSGIVLIGGLLGIRQQTGFLMSKKQKVKIMSAYIKNKEYEKAKEMVNRYCPESSRKDELLDAIDLCKKYNVNNTEIAIQMKKTDELKAKQLDDYKKFCDNVEITDVYSEESSRNYFNACAVVENNNNKSIGYIQLDVFLYDENGVLVDTAMTNATSIPANSKRIVKKMLPCGDGGTWNMQITKINMGE